MVLPLVAGIAASFLPGIIDALVSSKSKEEAAQILAPEREAKIAELVGRGVRRDEATAQVDEGMQVAIQDEMQKGSLPAWTELGLGLVTGAGGAMLAKKLGKKATKKAAPGATASPAKPVTPEAPIAKTKGELPAVDDPPQGIVSPFGPKPAPRKSTPIGDDIEPQSLPGKTGLSEIDEMADEGGTLMRHTGGTMPMGREQIALREAAMASRANPSTPPGVQRPFRETPRLGYEEPTERGFQTQVGMTGGVAPMSAEDIALREAIQMSRRSPSAPPGIRRPFQPRLGYDEPAYQPAARPRSSLTGVPSEPIGFDPLTGAPIY